MRVMEPKWHCLQFQPCTPVAKSIVVAVLSSCSVDVQYYTGLTGFASKFPNPSRCKFSYSNSASP